MMRIICMLIAMLVMSSHVLAVQPSEVLGDPVLEERARKLSAGLRCMVCQNQSIDDSDAELARDLRVLVRERLVAGETDKEVIDYVVSRYGEFVLLQPKLNVRNALLWSTPLILLLIGGSFLIAMARRNKKPRTTILSSDEEKKLAELLSKNAD